MPVKDSSPIKDSCISSAFLTSLSASGNISFALEIDNSLVRANLPHCEQSGVVASGSINTLAHDSLLIFILLSKYSPASTDRSTHPLPVITPSLKTRLNTLCKDWLLSK